MSHELWQSIADEAARDPSRAGPLSRYLAELLRGAQGSRDGRQPAGYVYQPAHTWLAIADDVAAEPLPPPATRPQIFESANPRLQIKVPFDALVMGVAGWCIPDFNQVTGLNGSTANVALAALSQAEDFRDFFAVRWGLDGEVWFGTDGEQDMMAPAAVVLGSRRHPRALAWTLRRNQRIMVQFRNLLNAYQVPAAEETPNLKRIAIAFYALNLEAP